MTAPYAQVDGVTVYHGDASEILDELRLGPRFHAVMTDPPYMIGSMSQGSLATKTGTWADMMNAAHWFTDWYQRAWTVLRDDGCLWTFMNWRSLPVCMKAANDARIAFVSVMVWDKEWIGPGGAVGLRPSYELVALAGKSGFTIPDRGTPDIIRHKTGSYKPNGHPAEKPEGLVARLLEISGLPEDAHVLDPFAGSGTTGIAARRMGYRATLIEADERYCELIATRLAQTVLL